MIFLSGPSIVGLCAADIKVDCDYSKNKKIAWCVTDKSAWRCDKQKNGSWKCEEIAGRLSSDVPDKLKDAVLKKAQKARQ
jgi:hypothetical protein